MKWNFEAHPAESAGQKRPKSPWLVYIVAMYASSLLIANMLANHMLAIGTWTTSAGILTFPLTYILASTLSEIYGYVWARKAAWLSFALNALMAALIFVAIRLPQPEWYDGEIFSNAMGGAWRIVAASLTAFFFGKWINDKLFARFKKAARGAGKIGAAWFAARALASSLAGHSVDTAIFSVVAFVGVIPTEAVFTMIGTGVILKWGYEWLAIPLTVKFTKFVGGKELEYSNHGNE